ncbi:MAG: ribosome recycling factor [Planctomycetota bacterium]|jgi:ribosome recycling factor
MAEGARVAIRNARRDGNKEVEKQQKASQLTEDDAYKGKDEIQKLTDEYEKKVNEMLEEKTKEIEEF